MRFAFESCVLDLDTRQVFRDGKPADLSPKAFGLLELLVLQRPKAISKAEIHKALWPDTFVTETNLANLVVELRSALGDDAHVQKIVRTLPRFGYAFCADAHTEENNDVEETAAGDRRYCLVMGRREIVLLPGENLVGRDHSAAIWVNDESVSRRHARIAVDDAGAVLEDLGSKNGTFLRGRALTQPVRLEDGDEFTVGEVAAPIRFHCLGETATTRTGTKSPRKPDSG